MNGESGCQSREERVMDFKSHLIAEFTRVANSEIAEGQKAYMKHKFEFFGIQAPKRREIQRPFLRKEYLPDKADALLLIRQLWNEPQRELQYFGMDMIFKYQRELEKEDIEFLEFLITHKSWWDTVDFLAAHPVGAYLKKFPEARGYLVDSWLDSGNMWLQRTCLIYQLKYKEELDTVELESTIERLNGGKEFFINKAIGWILREYSKTDPEWVISYVNRVELHPMSRREAMKRIKH